MNYLPFLLSERSNQNPPPRFKFWLNGAIHEGLRHQDELFQLRHTFDSTQRDEVYKIGCDLESSGIKVVITFSGSQYRLWTSLRKFPPEDETKDQSGDTHESRRSDRPIYPPSNPFGSKSTLFSPLHRPILQPMQC